MPKSTADNTHSDILVQAISVLISKKMIAHLTFLNYWIGIQYLTILIPNCIMTICDSVKFRLYETYIKPLIHLQYIF